MSKTTSESKDRSKEVTTRQRHVRCLLLHAAVSVGVVGVFAAVGTLLLGFDLKHLFGELILIYIVIALHLCSDRFLRGYERLHGHQNNRPPETPPPAPPSPAAPDLTTAA